MAFLKSPDGAAILAAFGAFIFFLILHVVLLRRNKSFPANRAILLSFISGTFVTAGIYFVRLRGAISLHHSSAVIEVGIVVSIVIYILLVFHYLVWCFGMGEAAIRIRLLRELDKTSSKSAILSEILLGYNAEKILRSRLLRLVESGHAGYDGRYYTVRNKILLIQAAVEKILKRLLGIST